jgi:hypothetical protein
MDQKISVRKLADYVVDVGYAINILAEDRTPTQFLSSAYITNSDNVVIYENNQQIASTQILSNSQTAAVSLAGSLEITADLAKVTELETNSKVCFNHDSGMTDLSKTFTSYAITSTKTLKFDAITNDDIIKDDSYKISHIVTSVHRGKSLNGIVTLSSTVKSKGKDMRSELREKLSNIPIGGTVDSSFSAEMKSSSFEFSSEIIVLGQSASGGLLSNADFDSFIHSVDEYFKVDATKSATVVGYVLSPVAGLKSLGSYSVLQNTYLYTKEMNFLIKRHLLELKKLWASLPGVFERLVRRAKDEGKADWRILWDMKTQFVLDVDQKIIDLYEWMAQFSRCSEDEAAAKQMIIDVTKMLQDGMDYRISSWQAIVKYQPLSDLYDSRSLNYCNSEPLEDIVETHCWSGLCRRMRLKNGQTNESKIILAQGSGSKGYTVKSVARSTVRKSELSEDHVELSEVAE